MSKELIMGRPIDGRTEKTYQQDAKVRPNKNGRYEAPRLLRGA